VQFIWKKIVQKFYSIIKVVTIVAWYIFINNCTQKYMPSKNLLQKLLLKVTEIDACLPHLSIKKTFLILRRKQKYWKCWSKKTSNDFLYGKGFSFTKFEQLTICYFCTSTSTPHNFLISQCTVYKCVYEWV